MTDTVIREGTEVSQEMLHQYLMNYGGYYNEILQELAEAAKKTKHSLMLVGYEASRLIQLQLKLMNARKCIEIGVFTGYNTVSMALALPKEGKVYAMDISDEYMAVGKAIWEKHGLGEKIEILLGPAKDSLQALIDKGESGTFDFVFIDADKVSYDVYYEKALQLLRPGGMIGIDNVLWSFQTCKDESTHSESTAALHALNKKIAGDKRVDHVLLTLSDGLTLCRKI